MTSVNDIESIASGLEQEMKTRLGTLHLEERAIDIRQSKSVMAIGEIIEKLRQAVAVNDFHSKEQEIRFFKEVKPVFLSQHIFHSRLGMLVSEEPVLQSQKVSFYSAEFRRIRIFQRQHQAFIQYCVTGSTAMDEKYFIRGNISHFDVSTDRTFSTGYDELLARVLAMRLLKDHVASLMYQSSPDEEMKESPLTWTASKADLIELIYGLETIGSLNKGKADIKEIASLFERAFNISLGNYYRQFLDIRLRKKSKTTFLDEMRSRLEVRINDFH